MNLPVTLVGVGAGYGYDDSGPTHHTVEDVSALRIFPKMTIYNISDSIMAEKIADITWKEKGPNYVRLDRKTFHHIYSKNETFEDGLKLIKDDGDDLCIIATGNMVHKALDVSEKLKSKLKIIDVFKFPINEELLLSFIGSSKRIVTLEEHFLPGGLGSAVCEVLMDNDKLVPTKRIGIKFDFCYKYGGRDVIQKVQGVDSDSIINTIQKWVNYMIWIYMVIKRTIFSLHLIFSWADTPSSGGMQVWVSD